MTIDDRGGVWDYNTSAFMLQYTFGMCDLVRSSQFIPIPDLRVQHKQHNPVERLKVCGNIFLTI